MYKNIYIFNINNINNNKKIKKIDKYKYYKYYKIKNINTTFYSLIKISNCMKETKQFKKHFVNGDKYVITKILYKSKKYDYDL